MNAHYGNSSKKEEPATNFDDLEVRPRPDQATSICPVCKGYGRWNHILNAHTAYPNARHPHATHVCKECNGSGWIWELHTHDWKHHAKVGNCLNQWKCSICGKLDTVDSGD